jgi:hypothetical protein
MAELKKSIQQQQSFAIALLDISLPGHIDGFGVAGYIKSDPFLQQTGLS